MRVQPILSALQNVAGLWGVGWFGALGTLSDIFKGIWATKAHCPVVLVLHLASWAHATSSPFLKVALEPLSAEGSLSQSHFPPSFPP